MGSRKTYQTVLVTRDVDGNDLLKTEVPDEVGGDERSNETAGSSVD